MRVSLGGIVFLACHVAAPAQVFVLPATDIIDKPANLLDLEGRTLRFTPVAGQLGSYRVESLSLSFQSGGTLLPAASSVRSIYAASWRQALAFSFPFAGRTHNAVFVNLNGTISFDQPESDQMPARRNPWPDGTVRRTADELDGRALSRQEILIAALWQLNDFNSARISVLSAADRLVVTWDVARRLLPNAGYPRKGRNVFQAVLFSDGRIEISYQAAPEPDGIVGLFQGAQGSASRLDVVDRPTTTAEPVVAIRNIELSDLGSALRWRFTMGAPVPDTVSSGQLWYRVFLTIAGANCEASLGFTPAVRTVLNCGEGGVLGHSVNGNLVDLLVPKLALGGAANFSWGADAVWFGFTGRFDQVNLQTRRPVSLTPQQANPELDLSATGVSPQNRSGNIYEVFHYVAVSKNLARAPRAAYSRYPPEDDFFVPMLDFRPDDLFNHGPSSGQIGSGPLVDNIAVFTSQGDFGSRKLQVAISPLDFNGPRLAEWVNDGRRDYFNYAQAVGWIAHELTHRWTAHLQFREGGRNHDLAAGSHWLDTVDVASAVSVASDYSFSQYPERSLMDGGLYRELGGGRFELQELTYMIPSGFSGLDLYAMGLVSAEQMPSTFLLRNRQAVSANVITAEKVAVRGSDIVDAMGPRRPSSESAQKEFRLGVYLFHEPGRDVNPVTLRNARQIALQVSDYFHKATGGRMTVKLSAPMEVPLPRVDAARDGLAAEAPITAGSVVTLTGDALAVISTEPAEGAFVPQWNGTSVSVGGAAARVRQVAPDRLEVLLPAAITGDAAVVVKTRRGESEPFPLSIANEALYLWSSGERLVAALKDGGAPVTAETPVSPGVLLTLSVSGFKDTEPAFEPGTRLPAGAPVAAKAPLSVWFGELEAEVESLQMAPGLAGRLLITVKVPEGLSEGDVTVQVRSGELSSNPALLAVSGGSAD